MARKRRHSRRRRNPMGEDMLVGLVGAGMGALITYFYLKNLPAPALPATTTGA